MTKILQTLLSTGGGIRLNNLCLTQYLKGGIE